MTVKAKQSRYTVHVLAKALDLLDVLSKHGSLNLSELCQQLGQPKSSVFRYLVTLEERGYVRRSLDTEEYSLGIKLIELGRSVTTQFTVHEAAVPFMRRLNDTFRETVNLAILEAGKVVYLEILEGTQTIRMAARPGQRDFAHSTAIGKAILAYTPDSEVDAVIRRYGLPALTTSTITTAERLKTELAQVREIGYAVDNIENEIGVRCIGAPVFNHRGDVTAGISISGPADRLSGSKIEILGRELVLSARSISERLGHNGPLLSTPYEKSRAPEQNT